MAGWWRGRRRGAGDELPIEITVTSPEVWSAAERLAAVRAQVGDEHPDTIGAVRRIAHLLSRDPAQRAEAVTMLDWAVRQSWAVHGPDDPATLRVLFELGDTHQRTGEPRLAEPALRDALAGQERLLGPDHPDTLTTMSSLADVLGTLGAHAESLRLRAAVAEARSGGAR
jgi:hypothetical protein